MKHLIPFPVQISKDLASIIIHAQYVQKIKEEGVTITNKSICRRVFTNRILFFYLIGTY